MRVTYPHPNPDPRDHRPARFTTSVERGGRAATVQVIGELDAASSTELATELLAAGTGGGLVRLDLSGTTFIDSAGIRVLVRSMLDLREGGCDLALVAASPAAENILRITGILDVLKDPAP